MFKFVANHLNIQGMKGFPKFQKFAAGLVVAFAAAAVSALWCTSSLVENAQAECLLEDYDYGLVYYCEGSVGHCYFERPNGETIPCSGTNGVTSIALPPIIVVPTN